MGTQDLDRQAVALLRHLVSKGRPCQLAMLSLQLKKLQLSLNLTDRTLRSSCRRRQLGVKLQSWEILSHGPSCLECEVTRVAALYGLQNLGQPQMACHQWALEASSKQHGTYRPLDQWVHEASPEHHEQVDVISGS